MLGHSEGRRTETIHGVARFAPVERGRGNKLPRVGILMAVQTGGIFYVILGVATGG